MTIKTYTGVYQSSFRDVIMNRDCVLRAIDKKKAPSFRRAPEGIRDDPEVATAAVRKDRKWLPYVSQRLRSCKEFCLPLVKDDGKLIAYLGDNLRDNENVMLAAVEKNFASLAYASDRLKSCREFVHAAVSRNGYCLLYVCDALKKDYAISLAAVAKYPKAIAHVPMCLKTRKDFVIDFLRAGNTKRLHLVHASLRDDKDVVLAAISAYPENFKFTVNDEHDVVMAALEASVRNFEVAPYKYRTDKELVLSFIARGRHPKFYHLAENLQDDEEIVLLYAGQPESVLFHASFRMRDREDVVSAIVERHGLELQYASGRLRDCEEVVYLAVSDTPVAIKYASDRIRANPFLLDAFCGGVKPAKS